MKNPMRALAYKNQKVYDQKKDKAFEGYFENSGQLREFIYYGSLDSSIEGVMEGITQEVPMFPDSVNKHRKQCAELAVTAMEKTLNCSQYTACRNLTLCPDCLANWRYGIAKSIQKVGKNTRAYRLVYRREHYFYPRAVYLEKGEYQERVMPMYLAEINPIHALPDAHAPFIATSPEYGGGLNEYMRLLHDENRTVADYTDMFCHVWNHIGGPALFTNFMYSSRNYLLNMDPEKAKERKAIIEEKLKKQSKLCYIDPANNWFRHPPLMLELACRRRLLNKQTRDQPGSVHRITILPVVRTNTMLQIRLDSLFIMTPDCYENLKKSSAESKDDVWCNQRHAGYKPIDGVEGSIWSCLKKVNCRIYKIPTDVIENLKIVERAFPFTGDRLAKCLPSEMALILGAVRNMKSIKTDGCFLDANRWA